jgi:hypothetical protein
MRELLKVQTVEGIKYWLTYKVSWQKMYYSFDDGETFLPSKKDAFAIAQRLGTLKPVSQEALARMGMTA